MEVIIQTTDIMEVIIQTTDIMEVIIQTTDIMEVTIQTTDIKHPVVINTLFIPCKQAGYTRQHTARASLHSTLPGD